ncbi:hypothetical protein ACH5RR_020851 [Cinchona calisaya]|uniref:Cytochrome P450 n=1 Tax=Cinchona calisaya TaxID=153742 RepID=A0ABD2ZFM4_9GENT
MEVKSDLLDILLDVMENENCEVKFTRNHLKALILCWTDTSSSAVDWASAEVINHPGILQNAQKEIDHVVGHQSLMEESDDPNLPYIQAIMKEPLWLNPSVPPLEETQSIGRAQWSLGPKDSWVMIRHIGPRPFSTGRRGCPGMVLSMHELPIVVAAIIQCFDWKIPCLSEE